MKWEYSLYEIEQTAQKIIAQGQNHTIWLFEGEVGAGKTTLIKAIGGLLGIKQVIQSPTFALVYEYRTSTAKTVFHFDFYRIQTEEEVYDIGYEDYFFSGNICLIEWASKIPTLLPPRYLKILMQKTTEDMRTIKLFEIL